MKRWNEFPRLYVSSQREGKFAERRSSQRSEKFMEMDSSSVSLGFRLGFEKRELMRFCEKRELGFHIEIGKDEY
jgi:hypothetical protein